MPSTGPLLRLTAYKLAEPLPKRPADFALDPGQIESGIPHAEARRALDWLLEACREHGRWAGFDLVALIGANRQGNELDRTIYKSYASGSARIRNNWRRRCLVAQRRWRRLSWIHQILGLLFKQLREPQLPPKPTIEPGPTLLVGIEGFHWLQHEDLVRIEDRPSAVQTNTQVVFPTMRLIWLLVWAQNARRFHSRP
ncbi:MAG TPA: hypothetical protein VLI05_01255 [Candidatus Saccharimonadia bacterium]|nr:hypothetical protein [Candidatus Saccharimonadia bacterium]